MRPGILSGLDQIQSSVVHACAKQSSQQCPAVTKGQFSLIYLLWRVSEVSWVIEIRYVGVYSISARPLRSAEDKVDWEIYCGLIRTETEIPLVVAAGIGGTDLVATEMKAFGTLSL